jgi:cytochrome c553
VSCVSVLLLISTTGAAEIQKISDDQVSNSSLEDVLSELGLGKYTHSMNGYDEEKAKMGKDLILNGRTRKEGKKSKRISSYFVCTDCHNLGQEFKALESEDASDRLTFSKENGLPFLPGSTFYGIYNRTSFYNNDYVKKYGDLVTNARDTLENSVQLCAKYCSSGRYLKDWELEAIMHYFKKNELHIKDLDLSEATLKSLRNMPTLSETERETLKNELMNSHRTSYSATFLPTMDVNLRKFGEGGNVENGKLIYNKSCLHCHANRRVTYLNLDNDRLSAKMFVKNLKNYKDKSLYQIIRYGTYAKAGRKQYMPLYTEEKMSDDQINDLVAYIKQLANK